MFGLHASEFEFRVCYIMQSRMHVLDHVNPDLGIPPLIARPTI